MALNWRLSKAERKYQHEVIFSVYNLYNRINPVALHFNKIQDESGSFVTEEILPTGSHTVEVAVVDEQGAGELYLRDLESGMERRVFAGLDRDLQETNGSHGNYPAMAWMPDGEALVAWGGGHFHRIDVASGEAAVDYLKTHRVNLLVLLLFHRDHLPAAIKNDEPVAGGSQIQRADKFAHVPVSFGCRLFFRVVLR